MPEAFKSATIFDLTQCVMSIMVMGVTSVLMVLDKPIGPEWIAFVGLTIGYYFGNRGRMNGDK